METSQTTIDLNQVQAKMFRLKEIIEIETEHLKDNDPRKLEETYDEKLELIHDLEEQKKLLRNEEVVVDKKDTLERENLIEFAKDMDHSIERHGRHLIKAREVNKYMMDAIATAVREHFKEVGIYDGKGIEGQYIAKGESDVPPMQLNNTF